MDSPFFKMFENKRNFTCDENENVEEQIELTLGLSLNGRFGVDPTRAELYRSSSISVMNPEIYAAAPEYPSVVVRTSSLPTEKGEAWRKRKEIQSLKRQEANGMRLVKRKSLKIGVIGEQIGVGIESDGERGEKIYTQWPTPTSQGSTGSSGVSQSASPSSLEGMVNAQYKKKRIVYANKEEEIKMRNVFLEMPCVFTKGDGPNGKSIEGFLYQYNREREVKIVCVCHGRFHSPVEFVRHAGCTDVDHPLQHIVVNPFPDM